MTAPEPRASGVNLSATETSALFYGAAEIAAEHFESIRMLPVSPAESEGEMRDRIGAWLAKYDFDHRRDAEQILSETSAQLRRGVVHTTHPHYFGLFNPAPTAPSVAADLLAAAINPQLAATSHAPAAVAIERHVLRFVADRLVMPATTLGGFTSGGAEANHTATITALTARIPDFAEGGLTSGTGRPVLYASAESHLAWLKIAHACGLGRSAVRLVPVEENHQMDIAALTAMHEADERSGARPFMIVGTAGTTGAGALDPLPVLAELAQEWGLSFHVDAAWAGAIALSDTLRPLLDGIERADSVTVDAHKWLSVTMGAGMFFSANPEPVREAFRVSTAYMPAPTAVGEDPYTSSMQWSRRAIGLKVFLSLATFGRAGYAEQIEHDTALGRYIAERADEEGWQQVNSTPLPVVCLVDPIADAAGAMASLPWHNAVTEEVVREGQAWVSSVRLNGRPAIRICVTNHRSTTSDADALLTALSRARNIVNGSPGWIR